MLGSSLALLPNGRPARAQSARVARVGVLSFGEPEPYRSRLVNALRDLGYVEGRNLAIEHRSAGDDAGRLSPLAVELARSNVEVIVARTTPSIQAAMSATRTIPIVMATAGDALRTGLVASLARPGGNVTGLSLTLVELAGKTVELLREAVPRLTRVACIVHRDDPLHEAFLREGRESARRVDLAFRPLTVQSLAELERAFASNTWGSEVGVMLQPIFAVDAGQRAAVVRLTLAHRSPAVCGLARFAEDGGLMAYASEFDDVAQRAARYVDRILKGATPGSLPVEQPKDFALSINVRTAKSLGIAIPRTLLARARLIG